MSIKVLFWTVLFCGSGLISVPTHAQEKLERMNIGYSAQAGAFAPIWITKEAGLFKKNGLGPNYTQVRNAGSSRSVLLVVESAQPLFASPAPVAPDHV